MPTTASLRHPLTRTLVILTMTTGLIDAACYLGLGRVFAANMTGNIVLLGFGIVGSAGLPVLGPLVSLAAFVLGAAVGGRMDVMLPAHSVRFASAMWIEIGVTALATVLAIAFDIVPGHFSGDLIIGLLAFAMGVRNATVRRLGVPDLSTTVLTMTLTGFVTESQVVGGHGKGNWRRGTALVAMLVGAVVGALLVKADLALVLLAASLLALSTWLVMAPAAVTSND